MLLKQPWKQLQYVMLMTVTMMIVKHQVRETIIITVFVDTGQFPCGHLTTDCPEIKRASKLFALMDWPSSLDESTHIQTSIIFILYSRIYMPLVVEYLEFILSVNIPSLMHLIPWITIVARIIPPPNSENIKIPPNKEKCKRFSIKKDHI